MIRSLLVLPSLGLPLLFKLLNRKRVALIDLFEYLIELRERLRLESGHFLLKLLEIGQRRLIFWFFELFWSNWVVASCFGVAFLTLFPLHTQHRSKITVFGRLRTQNTIFLPQNLRFRHDPCTFGRHP